MSRSRLPVTYENFDMLRDLATRLCWDNQLERGLSQLEHAGYILSALNVKDVGGEMRYLGEASDITDDMSCITQKLGRNGDACKYQNLRLQTLTSIECPLESFVDPEHLDQDGDEILVLRDAYSTMAAFCIENGAELQRQGQPTLALGCFDSTHDFLRHCSLFSQNHVQVKNVRRNLASVFRELNRTQEADQYDALVLLSNNMPENPTENRPYTNFKKIFFRATPGGMPELYLPTGSHIGGSDENKAEIQKLAVKLLILQEPHDGDAKRRLIKKINAAQTLQAKTSSSNKVIEPTYYNFLTVRELAKTLCFEKKYSEAIPHLEHAACLLSQITVVDPAANSPYADEAANILDDMSCIYQENGDYKNAFMYQMIRLQTLTGLESPLDVSFIVKRDTVDTKEFDDYDLLLTDTHSALFSILKMEALKMQSEGQFEKALKSFHSANAILERCFLIPNNNAQIKNTMLSIVSVLKAMHRDKDARPYEAEIRALNGTAPAVDASEWSTYTHMDKIFFRPVHGGAPQLYVPSDQDQAAGPARKTKASPQSNEDIQKKRENAVQCLQSLAAMEFTRKTQEADKAMQELLEKEEQEKKKTQEKVSKTDKKKKNKAKQAERAFEELVPQEPHDADAKKRLINKIKASRTPQPKTFTIQAGKLEATYDNVVTIRDMAKTLCFDKKAAQALPHLEQAAYLLSKLTIENRGLDTPFSDQAANILDDMSCIYQLRGDYKNAFTFQMIRLQTLTGLESPLEVSFIVKHHDDKHNTYDIALSDTHSALFSILNMEAVKMQSEGNLPKALKSFESANAMLERCFLVRDNNIQIVMTLLNIASVLKAMNRDEEAQKYEALTLNLDYRITGLEVATYKHKDKIFHRPVHGGLPQLYIPSDEDKEAGPAMERQSAPTSSKNMHTLSFAAMEFDRKTQEADKAMQELLDHEEQEKKNAKQKGSKRDKKKKNKAKQIQERNQDADKAFEELVQEQQNASLSISFLPVPLSPPSPPLPLSLPLSPSPSSSLAPPSPPLPLSPSSSLAPPSPPLPLSPSSSLAPPSPPLPLSPSPPHEVDIASYLEHFFCPISLEIMKDPVITADGSTFERARIEEWFRDHNTNPLTNEIVPAKTLIPNKTLKAAILAAQDLEKALRISDGE